MVDWPLHQQFLFKNPLNLLWPSLLSFSFC